MTFWGRKRQNLLRSTVNLSAAPWGGSNISVATDTTVAPDGLTLAYEVADANTNNAVHVWDQTVTGGMYGSVTIGCFLKAELGDYRCSDSERSTTLPDQDSRR